LQIVIDWQRAYAIFDRALRAYERRDYPYNKVEVPQIEENLPRNMKSGGVEHAIFLFCICYYMRGGKTSDEAVRAMSRIHEANPKYFSPLYFIKNGGKELELVTTLKELLVQNGLIYKAHEVARHWVANSTKIATHWDSNPLTLLSGTSCYEEACANLMGGDKTDLSNPQGFYGFRHKMVSMLIYFFTEQGLMKELYPYPVPVDFHILRISVAHKIITVPGGNGSYNPDHLSPAVREVTQKYCEDRGASPIALCEALWLLSRTSCRLHPGNSSHISIDRKGRKTEITPIIVDWRESQTRKFERSCGICSISRTCQFNIPSSSYYVQGKIRIRGKRETPPQETLF
jgi:hypothetical protein